MDVANDFRNVRPKAPIRPLLTSARMVAGPSTTQISAVTDLPHVTWLCNGRSAIAHAALLSGVGPGSTVLLPAYHCESMAAPFSWLGARVKYFRIQDDLSVDIEHLMSLADEQTRLVLAPQYFGHWRSTAALHEICQQRGWKLVEDCAHAFFARSGPDFIGRDSDYVVASSSKFFAAFDGGVLAARHAVNDWPVPKRPTLRAEVQAILNAIEYAAEYGRLPRLRRIVAPLLSGLQNLRRSLNPSPATSGPASRHGGFAFEPGNVLLGATYLARWLASHSSRAAIADARRANWQSMRGRLASCDSLQFPLTTLGQRDVPYVLALEIPVPERVFPELKRRGVPVYRWETSLEAGATAACPVSARFRRTLIQLPCHEGLTVAERDWIADTILSVV